jgi:hypothetical protein
MTIWINVILPIDELHRFSEMVIAPPTSHDLLLGVATVDCPCRVNGNSHPSRDWTITKRKAVWESRIGDPMMTYKASHLKSSNVCVQTFKHLTILISIKLYPKSD